MMEGVRYTRLPDGLVCRCPNLWRESDGSLWCCQQQSPRVLQTRGRRDSPAPFLDATRTPDGSWSVA